MLPLFSLSGDQEDTTSSPALQPEEASVDLVTAAPKAAPVADVIPDVIPKKIEHLPLPQGQYVLRVDPTSEQAILKLKTKNTRKFTKVMKALGFLADYGPEYPTLRTKKMTGQKDAWVSFAENGTPGAWRLWWTWGTGPSEILITEAGPTPS